MNNSGTKRIQNILSILIIILMLALVTNPNIYMQATLNGIKIWFNNVLPALFPFFFLTKFLTQLQILDKLAKLLEKPMQKLFHCPGVSAFVYLMSIISGYPIGAKLNSELFESKKISKDELVRINSFTSTSGPLFVIGSVGVGMFLSKTAGIIILISHLIGALINGLLYRNYHYKKVKIHNLNTTTNDNKLDKLLSDNIYNSIISILIVGGYIALCSVLISFFNQFHIISFFTKILEPFFSFILPNEIIISGILSGIIEITNGCVILSPLVDSQLNLITIITSGLISFGGLSINLQAITFLSKCKISIPFYFFQKFTQSIISIIICFLLLTFINI